MSNKLAITNTMMIVAKVVSIGFANFKIKNNGVKKIALNLQGYLKLFY